MFVVHSVHDALLYIVICKIFAGYKCVFIIVVYWNAVAPGVLIRSSLSVRVGSSETIDL